MRHLMDTVLTWLRQWESDKWIHVVAFLLLAWLGDALYLIMAFV